MILDYLGIHLTESEIALKCETTQLGVTCLNISSAAEDIGFNAEVLVKLRGKNLLETMRKTPSLLLSMPVSFTAGSRESGIL
jgi:ABC-type bacteriocin/lantibiotic exporter with double-glycine peptidase domain